MDYSTVEARNKFKMDNKLPKAEKMLNVFMDCSKSKQTARRAD